MRKFRTRMPGTNVGRSSRRNASRRRAGHSSRNSAARKPRTVRSGSGTKDPGTGYVVEPVRWEISEGPGLFYDASPGMNENAVSGPEALERLGDVMKEAILTDPEMKEVHDQVLYKMDVAHAMKKARLSQNLTQSALAKLAGTTQPMIARIENPSSEKSPTVKTVSKVAGALGYQVRFALFAKDTPQ